MSQLDKKPILGQSPRKKTILLSVILIITLGFAVYGNSINGEFIWDDEFLIEKNTYIKGWSHVPQVFTEDIGSGGGKKYRFYRPLQMMTYMVDYSLWKLNVKGYHLTNILLHVLVALGIYSLVNVIFKDNLLSLLTGSFFVVHPIHTEAVTYISGRTDSLALLFMLLCFLFYIKAASSKGMGASIVMLVSYTLALLSRESSLILPVLLLLYHYSFKKKLIVKEFFLIIGLAVIYIVLRVTVLKGLLADDVYTTTLFQRLPGFFVAITNYVRLLFLPVHLHMEYGSDLFYWGEFKATLGLVIMFALMICAFRKKRNDKLVFFSISWFFVALLPVSNFYPINAYMAEHWLYLPSVGFFLIMAKVISSLYRVKNLKVFTIIFVIGLLTFYSYLTVRQNGFWKDPLSFYERTLKYAPNSSKMNFNLGLIYRTINRGEEAAALYKKAIEIKPGYAEAYNNLGIVYLDMGKKEEAVAAYKKAIESKANYAKAYFNLGNVYDDIGKTEEAIASYKKAIEIKADYAEVYNNLGVVYTSMNKKEEAVALYKKAIEINPGYAPIYNNLAAIYFQKKQYQLAIEYCDKAKERGSVNSALMESLTPYRK